MLNPKKRWLAALAVALAGGCNSPGPAHKPAANKITECETVECMSDIREKVAMRKCWKEVWFEYNDEITAGLVDRSALEQSCRRWARQHR